jgi:ribose transport system substrate-binding protein
MALGVADALHAAGRAGSVSVIGMDGTRAALRAVRRGRLSATVAQYPYAMGQLGLEACAAAARGRRLPARVDAPVEVVTRENATRALRRFPRTIGPFPDPLRELSR